MQVKQRSTRVLPADPTSLIMPAFNAYASSSSNPAKWRQGDALSAFRTDAKPLPSFSNRKTEHGDDDFDEQDEQDLSTDESDEEEDEEGEELTPAMDAAILRTLRMIKSGDKGLYEEGNVLQSE